MGATYMGPETAIPISVPANMRGRRPSDTPEEADKAFLVAVSRAFLTAVNTEDRHNARLFSRAMLSVMNKP